MEPVTQSGKLQAVKRQASKGVRALRRKRVMSLTADERRQIVFFFDQSHGDADYVCERVTFAVLQRADVLAVVLAEMRCRRGPEPEARLSLLGAVA